MKLLSHLSTEYDYDKFYRIMDKFFSSIQLYTERFLTHRRKVRARKLERQKRSGVVMDWVKSFLWAAMVVLLVNQYFFQAYQIPSGSMMNTLLIKDRIFVNKFCYGPELVPGLWKLPGLKSPERGDIIIFESPSYISHGPVFDVTQRILYMVTLSLVDLDRDSAGEPKAHFLIKRAVGTGGDRLRFVDGNLEIRPAGVSEWIREADFSHINREPAKTRRLVNEDDYSLFRTYGYASAYYEAGLYVESSVREKLRQMDDIYVDPLACSEFKYEMRCAIDPSDSACRRAWCKSTQGWYIPEGYMMPLGENRDNSRDGRYFGPVRKDKVLGQAMFIYWPAGRSGQIR